MMKFKNMGLLIFVVFFYVLLVFFYIWIIWKETIWMTYPFLIGLFNRDIVLINIIIHVAGTYFFATVFEFVILLIFLKNYHLKFTVFIYIPFVKLISYLFILFGIVFIYSSFFFSIISLIIFYIVISGGSTVYIEYILLLYKFEKSGVWFLDKKLKSLTLAGIIVANIIPFSYNFFLLGFWPPTFLFFPFNSF